MKSFEILGLNYVEFGGNPNRNLSKILGNLINVKFQLRASLCLQILEKKILTRIGWVNELPLKFFHVEVKWRGRRCRWWPNWSRSPSAIRWCSMLRSWFPLWSTSSVLNLISHWLVSRKFKDFIDPGHCTRTIRTGSFRNANKENPHKRSWFRIKWWFDIFQIKRVMSMVFLRGLQGSSPTNPNYGEMPIKTILIQDRKSKDRFWGDMRQ